MKPLKQANFRFLEKWKVGENENTVFIFLPALHLSATRIALLMVPPNSIQFSDILDQEHRVRHCGRDKRD